MANLELSLSQKIENDHICDDFEAAWERHIQNPNEDRPKIEEYLRQIYGTQQSLLFRDLLASELACLNRRGDGQSREEYLTRFPDQADTVRELLTQASDDARPTEEHTLPDLIGRYRIVERVATGGFGTVYRACDDTLRRDVAIKIPHHDRFPHPEDMEAYFSEAQILAQLRHPHIVLVHDVAKTDDGQLLIVSQFVDGKNLAEQTMNKRLEYRAAAELISQIADALHYAHGQKIVHRDVKPANILLDAEQRPYLADFGLALTEEDYGRSGRQGGTIAYMSPEQARREGHLVDGRSDIFSLGAVLYELLTGVRPFQGENWQQVLDRIIQVEARPPRMLDDTIPKELERICLKALAKKAADRFSVARDMSVDLRHFLDERRTSVSTPSVEVTGASRTRIIPKGLRAYDAEDADFFLDLVPGPRDRNGLPEPIRFWKTRIEKTEHDETFRVGLVYGPSGCGKSSLIKAGLIPQLTDHVVTVHVECTASDTEARLLQGLQRSCHFETETNLIDAIASIRTCQRTSDNRKVFIVLDQFEQWLYARDGRFDGELVQALRQCDGARVQCMLMVRDDFWLAVSRFMDELDIDLLEGENTALADLFDQRHARKVLADFGRAYGCLPDDLTKMSADQELFLDQVVSDLSQDDKVISVRLSLFAEMVKGKPWTRATLTDVQGTEGVRVMFLNDTFVGPSANPKHRQHQKAARLVLHALVPEAGTDIKGSMRPVDELKRIAGYADRPRDFAELMRVLDRETRLLTPTEATDEESASNVGGEKYYQLTHDCLVPTLRKWLAKEQQKTRCGRAELLLKERTAAWKDQRDSRQLPAWWEVVNICCFARGTNWTKAQRAMMQTASRRFAIAVCLVMLPVAFLGWREMRQHRSRAEHNRVVANEIVERLWSADISQVLEIARQLEPYREDVGFLQTVFLESKDNDRKLRAGIAALKLDLNDAHLDFLEDYLMSSSPDEVYVLRDALLPRKDYLVDNLWRVLENSTGGEKHILPVASVLAVFDPEQERWDGVQDEVVSSLLLVNPVQLGQWVTNLRPIRHKLKSSLVSMYLDGNETQRNLAANALVQSVNEPEEMAELILDASETHFVLLYPRLVGLLNSTDASHEATLRVFEEELATPSKDLEFGTDKMRGAKRQANAAIALVRMQEIALVLPFLQHSTDPTARSYFIQRAERLLQDDSHALLDGLAVDPEVSIRQALILALCQLVQDWPEDVSENDFADKFVEMYASHKDAGVHSAVELLLRRWGLEDEINRINDKSRTAEPDISATIKSGHGWFVSQSGHTLIVLNPSNGEAIDYPFAVASVEITKSEFQQFLPSFAPTVVLKSGTREFSEISPAGRCPVLAVNWYEAAAYCNWISHKEGILEDQWCYLFVDADGIPITGDFPERFRAFIGRSQNGEEDVYDKTVKSDGGNPSKLRADRQGKRDWLGDFCRTLEVRIAPNWQERSGYRLPTEDEWAYAARCQTNTDYCFGSAAELLSGYAWYNKNSSVANGKDKNVEQSHPVGTRMPNAWGFFDMHGNAWEWCTPTHAKQTVPIGVDGLSWLRGGSYGSGADRVKYSERADDENVIRRGESYRDVKNGFRIIRRLPRSEAG